MRIRAIHNRAYTSVFAKALALPIMSVIIGALCAGSALAHDDHSD